MGTVTTAHKRGIIAQIGASRDNFRFLPSFPQGSLPFRSVAFECRDAILPPAASIA